MLTPNVISNMKNKKVGFANSFRALTDRIKMYPWEAQLFIFVTPALDLWDNYGYEPILAIILRYLCKAVVLGLIVEGIANLKKDERYK